MLTAFQKKTWPVVLAALAFALSGVAFWRLLEGDGYWALLGLFWFTLCGALFLFSINRPVLHLRDGMLLCSGIAVPLGSIRAARVVRLWEGASPSRILELQLSEPLVLSWHVRLADRFLSLWRFQWYRNQVGYTPPPGHFYLIYLPETDLSDEEIVHALCSPRGA